MPLAPMAINALKQQRLAIANGPDGLVFPSDEGTPLDHHNILARVWTPMLVGAGIFRLHPTRLDPEGDPLKIAKYDFHGLRHAPASLFIEQKLSPKRLFFFSIKIVRATRVTRIYARIRPFSPRIDLSVHTERTRKNGHLYKTLVRFLACPSPSQRSLRQRDLPVRTARLKSFGELIDLHIDDMCDVGKSTRRSKAAALDMLQRHLGKCKVAALDRERLIRSVATGPPKTPDR
ncbi:hypothetical protein X727_33310 [Mesorhizobium sp. L103C119B0]|uniref:hypothetical protein n=1 Tax=Mesorhizobium sp. L103C119B0 TaxID=1287085 RepID=UPI0003CFF2A0|nr:hypothetical protein [Mesorhizobium sp. L103C119B0]ESZ54605.1 hypothetical protein X727_33310 [Mesorhizobium sp. L103C119B0]